MQRRIEAVSRQLTWLKHLAATADQLAQDALRAGSSPPASADAARQRPGDSSGGEEQPNQEEEEEEEGRQASFGLEPIVYPAGDDGGYESDPSIDLFADDGYAEDEEEDEDEDEEEDCDGGQDVASPEERAAAVR